MRTLVILIAFAAGALAQRHKIEEVDTAKPEGGLLQQVMQENDAAKKTALMEQFAQQFPKAEGTPWVLEQLQALYVKANDPDKTIATGEKLLALDPGDPEAALQNLKAAEAKKDLPAIRKWADVAAANARKVAASSQDNDEKAYAKQVDGYTDYALYRVVAESRDPKTTIEFIQALEAHNPQSEYLPRTQSALFLAYRQTGANDKALALAEKALATDQTNEDMLLVVCDNYLQSNKEPAKVHAYSAKLVELMATKPKPEGVSDADWTAHRNTITGVAHYMNGKLFYVEKRYPQADKELRAALPLVDKNPAMKAEVLFELGFANYKMEKPQDAANFYRECAAMKSPFQADAAKSLKGIQTQFRGIK